MAENYIKPEDVSPEDAQKVLNFLNSAQSAEEIANAVEIPSERDVGIIVAQHILDRRTELGGFTSLKQVADVQQVGPERFTEIVTTLSGGQQGGSVMENIIEIQKYQYLIFSETEDARPLIYLRGSDDKHIGVVHFRNPPDPLPKGFRGGDEACVMFYRRSAFPELIDMLRNEKPVYIHWNPNNPYITTLQEPVGEGELP